MKTPTHILRNLMTGFLCLTLGLNACKKDTPDKIDQPTQSDYLLSETYQNGTLVSKHYYNGKNQVERTELYMDGEVSGETTYSYDDQNRLYLERMESNEVTIENKFEYNNGAILKVENRSNGDLISTSTYSYSGNTITMQVEVLTGLSYTHTYIKENGNIVKEEAKFPDFPIANWTLVRSDFDEGRSLSFSMDPYSFTSRNNPGREIRTTETPGGTYNWRWEYRYNSEGYLTGCTSYDYETGELVDDFEYKLIPAK